MGTSNIIRPRRPMGITALSGLCIVGGLGCIIFGLGIILIVNLGNMPLTTGLTFSISSLIVMGGWGTAVSISLLIGKKRAWLFGILSFGLGCIISVATLVFVYPSGFEYNLAFIVITGLIVYYLYSPSVKMYFARA